MIWQKWIIDTKYEAADIVASVLFDNGIVGVEIEDNKNMTKEELNKMYVDIPLTKNDDDVAKVIFYVSIQDKLLDSKIVKNNDNIDSSYMMSSDNIFSEKEFDDIFTKIKLELKEYREFMDLGTLNISKVELDDEYFLNKWKEYFKSFCIDNINIIPSFEKKVEDGNVNIYIEAGNAFGTGKHETTKLCIKLINRVLSNANDEDKKSYKIKTMLDVGCGSGILAILGYKLGVNTVLAIDVDENVEMNLTDNLSNNSINGVRLTDEVAKSYFTIDGQKFYYDFGNLIDDKCFKNKILSKTYDMITINILTPIIIKHLLDVKIYESLASGGYLILSGILKDYENEVRDTISIIHSLKIIDVLYENEWLAFLVKEI